MSCQAVNHYVLLRHQLIEIKHMAMKMIQAKHPLYRHIEYPAQEGHLCHIEIFPGSYWEEMSSRDAMDCVACQIEQEAFDLAVQDAEDAAFCADHCQQTRVRVNREGKTYIRHVADCANGQHAIERATWAAEEQRDNEAYARRREAGIFTADDLPF